jgi:hypothetical protein
MSSDASQTSMLLQESLRRYLERNPDAADAVEGIRQWWLTEKLRATSIEELRAALATLVTSGEMQLRILPDGTEFYARSASLNKDRVMQKNRDSDEP